METGRLPRKQLCFFSNEELPGDMEMARVNGLERFRRENNRVEWRFSYG